MVKNDVILPADWSNVGQETKYIKHSTQSSCHSVFDFCHGCQDCASQAVWARSGDGATRAGAARAGVARAGVGVDAVLRQKRPCLAAAQAEPQQQQQDQVSTAGDVDAHSAPTWRRPPFRGE